MKTAVDPRSFHSHEIVFSLLMGAIALVNRGNPLLAYPEILWSFALMLGFNLACQLALRVGAQSRHVGLAAALGNVVLVSLVLHASGGVESSFWPMYLIPVFTACLYLERRHLLLALASTTAFIGCFYLDALWDGVPWEPYELAIKLGVLALAAAVTASISFKERRHFTEARAGREKIERLAKESVRAVAPKVAHDINNPLTIILGTVELMLKDAPEDSFQRQDLLRIQSAARRCAQMTAHLLDYSRALQ